jgi:hypothetical protein
MSADKGAAGKGAAELPLVGLVSTGMSGEGRS